jgi:hypothetical protein
MSDQDKDKDADEHKDDGILIFGLSCVAVFVWSISTNHTLKESAVASPVFGIVLTFLFLGIRDLIKNILKK